jgi:hypothetical protein
LLQAEESEFMVLYAAAPIWSAAIYRRFQTLDWFGNLKLFEERA